MRARLGLIDRPAVPIPTLPAIVARLLALYGNEDYSSADLIRVLEADPAIASRLLRLANSAYYGLHRKVSSLERAVLVVGRVTVQAVALAATLLKTWEGRSLPPQGEDLWVHAYLCGLGCRHLSERLPASAWRSEGDALFLTGLLHDLGKILFLAESDDYVRDLESAPSREDLLVLERERFGKDHAEAGGEVLDAWDFPPGMAAVVRYHHGGGLRAELRADWEVLTTVDGLLWGLAPPGPDAVLPSPLVSDLAEYLEKSREEARAFFRAVT